MRVLCIPLMVLFVLGMTAVAQKPDLDSLLAKKTFEMKKGKDKAALPYRLMKPEGYKADGKEDYPLVVFLHGSGERGDDNKAQLRHGIADFAKAEHRKQYPCFLIVPQCPKNQVWVYGLIEKLEKEKPAIEPGDMVLGLIDALCKEYRIDSKRIYLTGLSMGGYGTWGLLARKPTLFAAAVPICGGGDVKAAGKIAKIPIWCFHGDKDIGVPVEKAREMIAAIKKAGGNPKYTEYKGVGHDSWTATYHDPKMHEWLFAQKKGS